MLSVITLMRPPIADRGLVPDHRHWSSLSLALVLQTFSA
jgi:hypothetical protein